MWCCDASKFTEHENHQTSNLNMKYSGEHNKRDVQITGRHSQPTGNGNKKRYAPRCQLLHHQIKGVKEPPSPLQTTVSYGIILSHGHKSTAPSAKRQFDTSNYYVHHKIKRFMCRSFRSLKPNSSSVCKPSRSRFFKSTTFWPY